MVIDKVSLEPFWKEFDLSEGYWSGNLKNVVGFVPFGFCFYAYFAVARRPRRAALLTLIWGALVSLTIEVLQAALPTRDSGTTDLITNTLGTWVGVLCYKHIYLLLLDRFPRLGWFAPNSNHGTLV
jgi:glycopeptide antibiotics resistance protein